MILTTGDFLKKILSPGFEPGKSSFFMPDHNGPCRFGQYNKLQRIIFNHLGYKDVEIISPSNATSYEEMSKGHGIKYRLYFWKGAVVIDMLRKLLQEHRPYEVRKGESQKLYDKYLAKLIDSVEKGSKDVDKILEAAIEEYEKIDLVDGPRKPVIIITGEIFMRDNPYANGGIAPKLEELGAEIMVAPLREWVNYSSYRYERDSRWSGNVLGLIKSRLQQMVQHYTEKKLLKIARDHVDLQFDVTVEDALDFCMPYVDKSYDGQPALMFGNAVAQVSSGVSGFVNVMPFTCMPETFVTAVTPAFRKDFNNIPWINIAYDGQGDTSINTKLQAFMHQAHEYAERNDLLKPKEWLHS